ncbi:uncharacterized protein LOC121201308 [Toxotes jaculatrix]|uniref:uncharacterized protein LOC121201308 n=1 Tax=Toxotes jaculatrix TaxID=941984 RepID=UPI001B3A984D|nr:uncharacterized protein LOC121201308 [Toxotes jaculatrix]
MSCLWICLSLLCSAFLQSSASSHEAVLLRCNETVEVEAGENVTLNCTVRYQNMSPSDSDGCYVVEVTWKNTSGNIPCDSGSRKYICEWDQNHVSLTISDVPTEENYTVDVRTDCGMAEPSHIKVQVKHNTSNKTNKVTRAPEQNITAVLIICIICITIIVVCIFYVLFGTNHGRKIRELIMRDKTQGDHRDSKEDAEAPLTTDPQV